jgi:hypothetical protein
MAVLSKPVNVSASGDNQVIAGVAGKVLKVVSFIVIPASSVIMKFTDGPGGTILLGPATIGVQGLWPGFAAPYGPGFQFPFFICTAGNDLTLNLGSAVQVGGLINFFLEPQ